MGLVGNKLAKQFPSIFEMALQQEELIMLNWPLTSEPKTWVRHLGMSTRDNKHCPFAPKSPPAPRFGNNLVICGNNPNICDNQLPFSSIRPSIWFFHLLWLARLWKNLVFLSLAGSHMALDLCLQNTSSWCNKSLMSSRTWLIQSRLP